MIDLTPLDVRKKKGDFRRALRGYEPALVDDFLDIVADRLEQLVRENATLSERVTRLEHQVAENRDRERALTDALVTAQAMREEITERTTREAEALRISAQQEAETQLKDAGQQADSTVRDAEQRAQESLRRAQEEAAMRLQRAEQEASTRLREAEAAASTRLREAEQAVERMHAIAARARAEEEAALRRLQSRQQQLVTSYKTFLQRELTELSVLAESLQPDPAEGTAPSAALSETGAAGEEAAAEATETAEAAVDAFPPLIPEDPTETGPWEADEGVAVPVAVAAVAAPTAPAAEADEDEEPFAPEPVYDEDLAEEEPIQRIEPVELLRMDGPEVAEESGEAVEEAWPDLDILPEGQEPDFSRPRPNPAALELPWSDVPSPETVAAAEAEAETEDDPETEALLQNAALAGYHLDLDDEAELLLDEPASSEGESDDWLDSIIEEDR